MAQDNLSACLTITLAYEGGLSLVRSDPGNWTGGKVGEGLLRGTKYGIAASAHPTLDIAGLTRVDAIAIYQRDYWMPAGCEALAAGLDLCHFDATVNSGPGNSAHWLAQAREASGDDVAGAIHAYAAARLTSLHAFKTWATFGKGWATRVAGIEAKALAMALGAAAPEAATDAARTAANRAKTSGAIAAAGTAAAGASLATAGSHLWLGLLAAILSLGTSALAAFHAAQSGARAAVLAQPHLPAP